MSMKDKRCFICKYQDKINLETTENTLFESRGRSLSIPLCYSHSVELFKMGQSNFVTKYGQGFTNYFGHEEDKLAIRYFSSKKDAFF